MCESERASYHPAPAWNDHYKRGGERPPSDDEIGEGREGEREREREGFSRKMTPLEEATVVVVVFGESKDAFCVFPAPSSPLFLFHHF